MKIEEIRFSLDNGMIGSIKGSHVFTIHIGNITSFISGNRGFIDEFNISHDFAIGIKNNAVVNVTSNGEIIGNMNCNEFSAVAKENEVLFFDIDIASEKDESIQTVNAYSFFVESSYDDETVQKHHFDKDGNFYLAIGKDTTIDNSFDPIYF